jgi:quercetin dioxygenase-like cupin family protein
MSGSVVVAPGRLPSEAQVLPRPESLGPAESSSPIDGALLATTRNCVTSNRLKTTPGSGLRSSALLVDLEDEMSRPHTQINLSDVQDAAPAGGFGDRWEARVARVNLEAEQTGVTYFRLRPGKRSPFAHRHARAEEVYVILAGSGRVKLNDEIAAVRMLDAIRIAPEVVRAFEAGPDGLEFLVFGPHHEADGEQVDDAWVE